MNRNSLNLVENLKRGSFQKRTFAPVKKQQIPFMKKSNYTLEISQEMMDAYGKRVMEAINKHHVGQSERKPVAMSTREEMDNLFFEGIPEEPKDPMEVLDLQKSGHWVSPENARNDGKARNPAFDVTPARLVTGIVTENGIAYPPFVEHIARLVGERV